MYDYLPQRRQGAKRNMQRSTGKPLRLYVFAAKISYPDTL